MPLRRWNKLNFLKTLYLRKCSGIDDATLRHLSKLPLRTLVLYARTLSPLPDLSQNRDFNTNIDITDAGIKYIEPISTLETLILKNNTGITDKACPGIAKLSKLTQLDLDRAAITDIGLKDLAKLPALKSLSLDFTQVGKGVVVLNRLPLEHLSLRGTKLSDETLQQLNIPTLRRLFLAETMCHDEGLMALTKMRQLEMLHISRCRYLTPEGISAFHKRMPKCIVESDNKLEMERMRAHLEIMTDAPK